MTRRRRILIALATLPAILIIGVWASGPYLAVNKPYGHGSLVVEGWIPEASLGEALRIFEQGRYDKLILTGATRPVSHYLRSGESLSAVIDLPASSELVVRVAGLPGVPWTLHQDGELILSGIATSGPKDHRAVVPTAGSHTWRLGPDSATAAATDVFALFVGDWRMDGRSIHSLTDSLWISDNTGGSRPAARDHATQAALLLTAMGLDPATSVVLPVEEEDRGRTAAAARRFARYAIAQRVDTCDVLTVGVHARRTWAAFREACGQEVSVGIIALEDPACGSSAATRSVPCWLKQAKELVGLTASAVD